MMNWSRYKGLKGIKDPTEAIMALLNLNDKELHEYHLIDESEQERKRKLSGLIDEIKN